MLGVRTSPADLSVKESVVKRSRLFKNVDGIKFLNHPGGCGGTRQDVNIFICKKDFFVVLFVKIFPGRWHASKSENCIFKRSSILG